MKKTLLFSSISQITYTSYHVLFCKEHDNFDSVTEIKRFRKRLFVDHHGWDLKTQSNKEEDQFDHEHAVHCALYHNANLIGTFRAIRTDYPYLTPHLFQNSPMTIPFPSDQSCWEISRFGVLPGKHSLHHAYANYAAMFYFAQHIQAARLVAVATLTYERFLTHLGIRTRRYGQPQKIGQDQSGADITAVAGEIPLHAQRGERFQKILKIIPQMKVTDAAQIFGPARISA